MAGLNVESPCDAKTSQSEILATPLVEWDGSLNRQENESV